MTHTFWVLRVYIYILCHTLCFCHPSIGLRLRLQGRQLQLGTSHRCGRSLHLRHATQQRPCSRHQQHTNGGRWREFYYHLFPFLLFFFIVMFFFIAQLFLRLLFDPKPATDSICIHTTNYIMCVSLMRAGHYDRSISSGHLLCGTSGPSLDCQLAWWRGSWRQDHPSDSWSQSEKETPYCASGADRRPLWFGLLIIHPAHAGEFPCAFTWKGAVPKGNGLKFCCWFLRNKWQEYGHRYKYGYVSHTNQRGLYKLSLPAMKYVKAIDLAPYNCVPRSLQYSSLCKIHCHARQLFSSNGRINSFYSSTICTDGLVIMECEEPVTRRPTGQIVMDYLTDTVLSHKVTLLGQPYITPDSRIVVTVHREKTSVTLIVQHTTGKRLYTWLHEGIKKCHIFFWFFWFCLTVVEEGLKFAFDVRTTLNVSHVIFHPSTTSHSYDLYATSADKGDVLFLNLEAGEKNSLFFQINFKVK